MRTAKRLTRPLLVAVVALIAVLILACETDSQEVTTPGAEPSPGAETPQGQRPEILLSPQPPEVSAGENAFTRPGFEDCPPLPAPTPCGEWFALKAPDFAVSSAVARSGEHSALLEMREPASSTGTKVFYLVQEVLPSEFPEVISGYYRVENWQRGAEKQYLQFVVIVWNAANTPGDFTNHQIRYILTGIDEPPFGIANAKFVFLGPEEPAQDEWVPFKVNVKQDFIDLWGEAPEGYERIRLLFEVRYDDKGPESPAEADVYYDDLYFGPADGASVP